MIKTRDAKERVHIRRGDSHVWTSVPDGGFGDLLELDDEYLPPESRMLARTVTETVLYLCNGRLMKGSSSSAHPEEALAGTFQRVSGAAVEPRSNASTTRWARAFRIELRPATVDIEPARDCVWYGAAQRRGRLRLVASSESNADELWIPQEVLIYSSILDPGQHVVCELAEDRRAWVHMVEGSADVLGEVLETHDSAEVRGVRAIGITALDPSEVLIVVVAEP